MLDGGDMVEAIRKIAVEAVAAGQPSGLYEGAVVSVRPLAIQIDQKTTLTEGFLRLTSMVSDFQVEMTVDHQTEDARPPTRHTHKIPAAGEDESGWPTVRETEFDAGHRHACKGRKTFTVHMALKAGEKVLLIREQGGQKYLVLDRLRGDG